LNCDERRDSILLYAAGALDAADVAELQTHLATGCPACAGEFAEAQAMLARLPLALTPVAPSDAVTARVLRKVRQSPEPVASRPHFATWRLFTATATAACIAALIVAAALWLPARRKARLVDSANVQLVNLNGGDPQPHAHGRIFWDRSSNNWHVVVFDLKPPDPGKAYELWFIQPDQKKIAAGTFNVDATGHATLDVKVPPDVGSIAMAAITDEPEKGVPQPTGTVQLLGHVP
jgi:anti-sigma-K factor RskA